MGERLLICGSRDFSDRIAVLEVLQGYGDEMECLISGMARGPDSLAVEWARSRNIRTEQYPAKWQDHGRAAGPIRNQRMLDEGMPTLCLAFWDGQSRGTEDMIRRAVKAGIPVRIISISLPTEPPKP